MSQAEVETNTTVQVEPQPLIEEPVEEKPLNMGICFIFTTKNCTRVQVTDITGRETYAKVSGGMKVKSKKDEGLPYAAIQAAQDAAERALKCGINACHIKLRARGGIKRRNFGSGAQSAIRAFISSGIKVGRIEYVTPIPSDGCRKKGGHRGRRV